MIFKFITNLKQKKYKANCYGCKDLLYDNVGQAQCGKSIANDEIQRYNRLNIRPCKYF